jgi:AraC family transcriptional regulator
MASALINTTAELKNWFHQSGVVHPLQTCIGPLPVSRASLGRWSCDDRPDQRIHANFPHPDCYRIAVMLAPLEARIWDGSSPIWGGMIAANRFRICPPYESGRWCRMSACDIVNIFIPIALVDHFAALRGDRDGATLIANLFTPDKNVIELVHKMLDAEMLAGPLATQICDSAMTILVCYLLEHYSKPWRQEKNHEDLSYSSGLSGARLRKILSFMANNTETSTSNSQLAAICAMSEAHFSREFRRAMGIPPHQYMMKLRLERACLALLNEETRIVDIAYECGFNNASHFTRAFASQFGVPPAQYRSQRRKSN